MDQPDLVPQDLYKPGPNKIGCKSFVYAGIKNGEIPAYRIGSKLFIYHDWRNRIRQLRGKSDPKK